MNDFAESATPSVVEHEGRTTVVLRVVDDFGQKALDLVGLPRRCAADEEREPLFMPNVDFRHVRPVLSPAAQLVSAPSKDSWVALTGRAQAKLLAAFLLGEDPQRRLDTQKAAALMHQMSLVHHILTSDKLRRVLIADEVGLGKTIEAGMIVRRVLEQSPLSRVLYLAPARLVRNVAYEFRDKLDLDARCWIAGGEGDARIESDRLVIASIHKAVFGNNRDRVQSSGYWDVIIIDECHHLSDWGDGGGKPNQSYKLAEALLDSLATDGRLILLSGTPHQGSLVRFENLIRLLADDGKNAAQAAGRVIYRTKDRVRDWRQRPLFPRREVRTPTVAVLGPEFHAWYESIAEIYDRPGATGALGRAAGWAKGQALQWASSSIEAGLGYLARLAVRRLDWTASHPALARALGSLRPYRGGDVDEPIEAVYDRMLNEVKRQRDALDDQEELEEGVVWRPDSGLLAEALVHGVNLLEHPSARKKWEALLRLLEGAGSEKVVLFAQPVETVTVVMQLLQAEFGIRPATIVGNQSDEERTSEIRRFWRQDGPQFLVSSRAGGEGLNLQVARRLIHLDVPWNPMELEQRVGRIHRFGSRKTVIVETVIVQGTREVDMYRIAREKLKLIATQLDSEQFELLFSRVMSLVPPRELETVLGNAAAERVEDDTAAAIGALVRQGFDVWEEFDRRYRAQAEEIRSLSPGEATWSDLREFLIRFANAEPAHDAKILAFDLEDDEVVSRDERVSALSINDRLYACADTSGSAVWAADGHVIETLGMNHSAVSAHLRSAAMNAPVGAGYLRRPTELASDYPDRFGVLAFLRHAVRIAPSATSERAVTYHVFVVDESGAVRALSGNERATLTRELCRATRQRNPAEPHLVDVLRRAEAKLAAQLKTVSDEEREEGVRPAVWPIAALIAS